MTGGIVAPPACTVSWGSTVDKATTWTTTARIGWQPGKPDVIYFTGFSGNSTAYQILSGYPQQPGPGLFNAVLAAGHRIIEPFTGANWGHPTAGYPARGGQGQLSATRAIAATGDPNRPVHVIGVSMGGLNALSYLVAVTDPTTIKSVTLQSPAFDLMGMWDRDTPAGMVGAFGSLSDSISQVWVAAVKSATTRAAVASACAVADPVRNTSAVARFVDRMYVVAGTADQLIAPSDLESWLTDDVGLAAPRRVFIANADHFFITSSGPWDDMAALRNMYGTVLR